MTLHLKQQSWLERRKRKRTHVIPNKTQLEKMKKKQKKPSVMHCKSRHESLFHYLSLSCKETSMVVIMSCGFYLSLSFQEYHQSHGCDDPQPLTPFDGGVSVFPSLCDSETNRKHSSLQFFQIFEAVPWFVGFAPQMVFLSLSCTIPPMPLAAPGLDSTLNSPPLVEDWTLSCPDLHLMLIKKLFIHMHTHTHHVSHANTTREIERVKKKAGGWRKLKKSSIPILWYCEKKSLPWWMRFKHGEFAFGVLLGEVTGLGMRGLSFLPLSA